MSQSRLGSFIESLANVVLGYGVAVGAQILIFPLFGVVIPLSSNLAIGIIFTLVSLVRSYLLRRLFNLLHRNLP
jgi:hypothetical protein